MNANIETRAAIAAAGLLVTGSLFLLPFATYPLGAFFLGLLGVALSAPFLVKCSYLFSRRCSTPKPWSVRLRRSIPETLPFFSIHVATYDEPPELVIDTLRSLTALDYPVERYEIIVLDNNTPSPATWVPVETWCATRGRNLKFYHYDNVEGAKAGALNIAFEHCDPRTSHIVVVDADYCVKAGFLLRAAELLREHGVTHLQFPQAYRNVTAVSLPMCDEYAQYFDAYAARSGSGKMLLTGTMSVIEKSILERVGAWPTDTITEDADLGARLIEEGGRGLYAGEVWGSGVMPEDLATLSVQRRRWAAGNTQTMKRLIRDRGRCSLDVAGQLCAWTTGAYFLPPLILAAALFSQPGVLAFVSGLFTAMIAGEAILAFATTCGDVRRRLYASIVRVALLPEGSMGLGCGLGLRRLCFVRTPKTSPGKSRFDRVEMFYAAAAAGFFLLAVWVEMLGFAWLFAALLTLVFTCAARGWLSVVLRKPDAPHPQVIPLPEQSTKAPLVKTA